MEDLRTAFATVGAANEIDVTTTMLVASSIPSLERLRITHPHARARTRKDTGSKGDNEIKSEQQWQKEEHKPWLVLDSELYLSQNPSSVDGKAPSRVLRGGGEGGKVIMVGCFGQKIGLINCNWAIFERVRCGPV